MSIIPIRVNAVCRGPVPSYATPGASGLDLTMRAWRYADTPPDRPDNEGVCMIRPGDRVLVKTGLRIELPEGLEAQVRPRSGLSLRSGDEPVEIRCGERVAQLVVAPVVRIASALHGKIDDATGYAMQQARCAADDHSQRVTIKHASTRSRFRKRSR